MRASNYPSFAGGAQLLINGLNQNRLLGELAKNGCRVYDVKRIKYDSMSLKVKKRALSVCLSTAEKLGFQATVERSLGFLAALKGLLPRLGLPIALIVMTVCYSIASGFIWQVRIEGNERVDSYSISETLKDIGVFAGAKKKAVALSRAESALRGMDGISEATLEISGNVLKVSVLESLEYESGEGGAAVILSDCDAEVTRIVLKSGTALVKVGQRVFAGEPLISGELIGTEGQVISEGKARGEVYGKVVMSESVTVALSGKRQEFTGRKKRSTVLSVFGWKIGKRKDGFESAQVSETTHRLSPFPIAVTSITARETVTAEYEMTEEQAIEQAKEIARERLREKLSAEADEETVQTYDLGGGMICVKLYMTVQVLIGKA